MGARYGQHFLRDARAIGAIVARFDPSSDDAVVEIGAGRGALTVPLASRVGALAAVEVDSALARTLASRLSAPLLALDAVSARGAARAAGGPHVIVVRGDALEARYESLAHLLGATAGRRVRVIGNLPYAVATALIQRMFAERNLVSDATVMVQKEVADRLLASPGSRDYGYLSVVLALGAARERLLTLGPGAFTPPPKVRSTVVALRFHAPRPGFALSDARLSEVLRAAFSERRKKAASNLARTYAMERGEAQRILEACGADPDARAEAIAPEAFARLAAALPPRRATSAPARR